MRALTLLGSLALGAAAVCLALGGAEGRAAGWVPSPTVPDWWRDATASGDDYPAARALFLARRDRARTSPRETTR